MADPNTLNYQLKALSNDECQQILPACATTVKEEPDVQAEPEVQTKPLGTSHTLHAKLPTFSGVEGKSEVSYEHWRSEVKGMEQAGIYPAQMVIQTICRSLR